MKFSYSKVFLFLLCCTNNEISGFLNDGIIIYFQGKEGSISEKVKFMNDSDGFVENTYHLW